MKARSPSSSIPTRRFKASRKSPQQRGWTCRDCLAELRRLGTRRNVEGMARFGIRARNVYGVSKPKMDVLAKRIGKDHQLALQLWNSGVHDARILAGMVDEIKLVTPAQMDHWVRDFDNWDVCDGTCCHLFAHTTLAWQKAVAWSVKSAEFQKRAGFALMAYLAVHDKRAADRRFLKLLPAIRREACDGRNFVRKAVSWALRQIGKRNLRLNLAAVREAERTRKMDSAAARWIAADALRELRSEAVQRRLRQKSLRDARKNAA
jgi:3-methyladenine DNA glycosylase AlkD